MATFGRLRLDVENCVRELSRLRRRAPRAGDPARFGAQRPAEPRVVRAARHVPRAPRGDQHRRPVARGPALPRDDRPRREDAGRLRVDPDGGQVRHLGADPRAHRIGQGSRRADDPRAGRAQHRALPGGELRGAARHAVRIRDLRLREGRVHRRARSQARASSRWRTRARCSSTRSATCRSSRRPSCCACSRSGGSSGSAATKRSHVDFRLISATNRPLDLFVRDSRFREDLYYRVNAFSIRLPSLRERPVDIPVLAQRFLARYCAANGLPLDGKVFVEGSGRRADDVSLAGQHPRAREHRLARGALVARPDDSRVRHRVPARRRHWPLPRKRRAAADAREAERAHIVRVLEATAGTRRRRRGCSTSAAARSTGRSSNTGWSPRRPARRPDSTHGIIGIRRGNGRAIARSNLFRRSISEHDRIANSSELRRSGGTDHNSVLMRHSLGTASASRRPAAPAEFASSTSCRRAGCRLVWQPRLSGGSRVAFSYDQLPVCVAGVCGRFGWFVSTRHDPFRSRQRTSPTASRAAARSRSSFGDSRRAARGYVGAYRAGMAPRCCPAACRR